MTTATDTATATYPTESFSAPGGTTAGPATEAPSSGFSIAALVLGLVSILAGFTFVVPGAGLVLGILALRREPHARTMAIWGIALNAVMLAGALLVTVAAVAVGVAMLPFAFMF